MSVRIFLSIVSDEFRTYRDQLRTDLTRHNVEVKIQEDFKDYGGVTLDKLDIYISNCDAVVHLVGDMTGAASKPASTQAILAKYPDLAERLPPLREPLEQGEGISYTQWEAWLALYHGKVLLIAQADRAAPRGPNFAPTAVSRAAQRAHLDRLRALERYPGCTFTNPDQLAKAILSSTILDLLVEERGGEPSRLARSFPYVGLIGVPLVLPLTPMVADQWARTLGVALAAPLALLFTVSSLALALIYSRYFSMLGAGAEGVGSLDRQGYDALRQNLATGGRALRLYSRWLTAFLDAVDRFFGDAGMADRTLFPGAFGLKKPVPLWTAPAFDRCLLLALIYPIATIFTMWTVSGHVGPAETALDLQPDLSAWQRGVLVAFVGLVAYACWRATGSKGWKSKVWSVVAVAFGVAFAVASAFAGVGSFAVAVSIASAVAVAFSGAVSAAIAGAGAISGASAVAGAVALTGIFSVVFANVFSVASAFSLADVFSVSGAAAIAFAGTFAGAVAVTVAILNGVSLKEQWQGVFLLLYLLCMIVCCFGAADLLSALESWRATGVVLLFLGLLTLINAPFDWASLGLTRALLRRGLELRGWWPYFLALADALAAAVIIALLAVTMVIGVQTFDALAVHGGGNPVLPLGPLFDGISTRADAPEFWWVYALLLSTMIPSLINLVIGGTALMRAVPGLSPLLLRNLPAAGAVRSYDRAWIAAVLTGQVAFGVILGVAAQALLAYGLIFYAMPAVGPGLLHVARNLAALELPMRLIQLFTGAS